VVCKWIGNKPEIANKHYLTVTDEHFEMAAATDTQNRDEIWAQTGDKLGTQPPATPRTALQRKSQFVINARENTYFLDIVGILENTLVAEEGLEESFANTLKYRVGKLKSINETVQHQFL
jgi:hypothetical protein